MNLRPSLGIGEKTLLFVSLSALLLLLASMPVGASGGRMPIYDNGSGAVTITLPGSYYLASDFVGDVTISVDHVTLDLMGHTVVSGNVVITASTVRVHNGIVEQHTAGKGIVKAGGPAGTYFQVNVDNLRVYRIEFINVKLSKISNCEVANGIDLDHSDRVDILHNTVGTSILNWGIHMTQSNHCLIHQNVVSDCGAAGIYLDACNNNRIAGNTVTRNQSGGIYLSTSYHNQIADNEISGNTAVEVAPVAGIHLGGSYGNEITRNTVSGTINGYGIRLMVLSNANNVSYNTVSYNGRPAGNLYSGIFVESNENTVQWNSASWNGSHGIEIAGLNNAVDWNTTNGNGATGIIAVPGASGNVFSYNRSLGNAGGPYIIPAAVNTIVDYTAGVTPFGTNK